MSRLSAMLDRLPPVYQIAPGALLHQLMSLVGLHMAGFDEDMDRVQRSHWVDHAFDRQDLAGLGALFDIVPRTWEPDRLYRARLKAVIAALLRGALTRRELEQVLVRILDGAQEALGVRYMGSKPAVTGASLFHTGPAPRAGVPAFVEFPEVRRRSGSLLERSGRLRPFDTFTVVNRSIVQDPTLHPEAQPDALKPALEGVLYGHPQRRTAAPVLVNLTNGRVVMWAGLVPCGRALALRAGDDGSLSATLDGFDVSDRLITGEGFAPDQRPASQAHESPRVLPLEPGENRIWFFPAALFDVHGLDVGRLANARPQYLLQDELYTVKQGSFEEQALTAEPVVFDAAVFHEDPAVVADMWWRERRPASFRFELPAGAVRRPADDSITDDDRKRDTERLFTLLQETIDRLRAAAVDGQVVPIPLRERQRTASRGRAIGAARDQIRPSSTLAAVSALFDVSPADGSRFE
ncbi:hypothetical protein [Haliangium sp.]|uniref:hypothetical protein n=1 Tax=Haliangium sp. TaxID=2663208 RepID=UPI003D12C68D